MPIGLEYFGPVMRGNPNRLHLIVIVSLTRLVYWTSFDQRVCASVLCNNVFTRAGNSAHIWPAGPRELTVLTTPFEVEASKDRPLHAPGVGDRMQSCTSPLELFGTRVSPHHTLDLIVLRHSVISC